MNKNYWKGKAFSVGYKSSKKNNDLYYRNNGCIVFFLKFNLFKFHKQILSTEDKFHFPLVFMKIKDIPEWKLNRLILEEESRLCMAGFSVFPAEQYCADDVFEYYPYINGYCKICNKDIQKNSLLCDDCRTKQKKPFIENAKHFIAKEINKLNSCMICGKKLYCSIDHLLYEYSLRNYSTYYFNSVSEGYDILKKLNGSFNLYDPQKLLINHHLCYYDEFTIDVCPTCHARIHHSNQEGYQQYKPVDKRIEKTPPFLPTSKEAGILGEIL